jgi:DNA-binding NarL/FixJ family response regulator
MNLIRVIIIDDNKGIRSLIREILEYEEDLEICGEAENLAQAREIISEQKPDIAILDISMDENEGGLSFLKEAISQNLSTKFIILSAHNEDTYSDQSLLAGAKGYICKDKTVQSLAHAIRDVQDGKQFVSSSG